MNTIHDINIFYDIKTPFGWPEQIYAVDRFKNLRVQLWTCSSCEFALFCRSVLFVLTSPTMYILPSSLTTFHGNMVILLLACTLPVYYLFLSRTGHERCSAFIERMFCSDVLFRCSVNSVQWSVNMFRCSGSFCSVFGSVPPAASCTQEGLQFSAAERARLHAWVDQLESHPNSESYPWLVEAS